MRLLDVHQLNIQFEQENDHVLSEINFSIDEGERLLLLGPSGCGKSTLTYALNGIYPRELDGMMTGEIKFRDIPVESYFPGEMSQHVGVVFQDPESQFCMITVEDEVAFGLENINTPVERISARIDYALQLVGLKGVRQRSIQTLSGGQKQKLALACVLAMEPELLILDEPTANLDPIATRDFIQTIEILQKEKGFALLVIEHQLDGWVSFIERGLMINRSGGIFYDGPIRHGMAMHSRTLQSQGIAMPAVTELVMESGWLHQCEYFPLTVHDVITGWKGSKEQVMLSSLAKESLPPSTILQLSSISWSKSNTRIISGVSMQIRKGEFIAIIGGNGSGKTSLSRVMAGLQMPTEGECLFHGKPLSSWKEIDLRQHIGYVFQNPEHQLIADTVFEEIAFSLRIQDIDERKIDQQVREVLNMCQLEGVAERHPYTLSQGQKRRLSVATMIVEHQDLLILDEPTFGQDAQSTKQLMNLLAQRQKSGATIVMVTHDMELVDEYADRAFVVHEGEVVADGHPHHLWRDHSLAKWQLQYPVRVQLQQQMEKEGLYVSS
ncbi:ABC transporter ATP-binding protein [Halobacillus naozhouensis]|uniref:ABC transporter ATP-binding protein n=1 Tax=Halobacillus naozhouensis TaxID=554880 RepID=A0ABY8IXU9_9BACI|nr:ABC transporter ATP-binding protein [Halobacillus naozhouensis]WFT74611.1 ABC transporter ATP-binding protein [Halobacillus naozhouensis]